MNTTTQKSDLSQFTNAQLETIRIQHLRVGLPEHSPARVQIQDEIDGREQFGIDINDKVEVLLGIPDPYQRTGQTGTIAAIHLDDDCIILKFDDGMIGMYRNKALVKN